MRERDTNKAAKRITSKGMKDLDKAIGKVTGITGKKGKKKKIKGVRGNFSNVGI